VCKYEGNVEWWRLGDAQRRQFDDHDFLNRALTLVGVRYGYFSLLWLGIRMALGWSVYRRLSHLRPSSLFCSSFVSYCYQNEGIAINAKAGDGATSPSDFALSGAFARPHQLFDGSDSSACDQLLAMRLGDRRVSGRHRRGSFWNGEERREPRSLYGDAPPR
jgi:hypothetical protein